MKSYQVPESECQREGRREGRGKERRPGVYEILIEWRRKWEREGKGGVGDKENLGSLVIKRQGSN